MSGIVCAVRGGPASHSTIRKGIELAREEKLPLTFLYVVNLDFLARTAHSRIASLLDDMRQLGEMILLLAADTAAAQSIEARRAVREGRVHEEIVAFCREVDADVVVVGEPLLQQRTAVFDREQVHQLRQALHEACRAQLVLVK